MRSKEVSAAADCSAEQQPAGEADRSTKAPKAVAGMGDQERKQVPEGEQPSRSKDHVEKKLQDAQDVGVDEIKATNRAIELHGGLTLKPAQASIVRRPTHPAHRSCFDS